MSGLSSGQRYYRGLALAAIPAAALALATIAAPSALGAQMLGVPVLQNAFANPGFTVAANLASDRDAVVYGLAAAWSPGGARFQVSAGIGSVVPDEGASLATGGLRVMVPVLQLLGGAVGIAGFAGGGGATRDDITLLSVPVGAAIGYRRAFGNRGVSVYAAPFYSWTRATADGQDATSAGVIRASVGIDVGVFRTVGLTAGAEFGATPDEDEPGPQGTRFGVGISYAFGGG